MRMVLVVVAAVALASDVARAESALGIALNLGTVIGSEGPCELSYDLAAIEAYIAANVPEADMGFMSAMNNSARSAGRELAEFGASQKTAHCAQVGRIARAFGFID